MNGNIARGVSLLLMMVAVFASGATVGFRWRANTETYLAGYRLYQGAGGGIYTNVITIPAPMTNFVLSGVEGTNFFALSAFGTNGLESALTSPPLEYHAPPPPPRPATPVGFEIETLSLVTESLDNVGWQPVITNELPPLKPIEIFRQRLEKKEIK